jgi:hypothetical protein
MKNNILKLYILAFYLCATFVTFAQPGDGSNGDALEGGDPPAPIDDYVWLLAVIGLAFVFLKFRAMHKQRIS